MTKRHVIRRSVAATVGAALAVAGFTACSSGDSASSEPIAYSDFAPTPENKAAFEKFTEELSGKYEGKTLKIMGVKDPWLPAFQKMLDQFKTLTGSAVTFENYSYDDTYSKEVLVGQQKSKDVDVIMYDLPWLGQFSETGFVEPLDERLAAADSDLIMYDDFYKVMRDGAVWDGKTLGVPFAPYFVMSLYNEDILKEAKVEVPTTIEEFQKACHAVTAATGLAGTAINNQSGTPVGQAYFDWIYNMGGRPFTSMHPDANGDYYSDMTPQFSSPESKATIQMFKDLLDCQPSGATNIAWQERYSAFATGQAAMISPWNYDIPPLDDPAQSAVAGKYGVQPVPTAAGVDLTTPVGGWLMGMNTYSDDKELAWDFIQWFSSPAVNGAFMSEGGFAARYSVSDNTELQAAYPWLETQSEIVDTAFPAFRPQVPEAFEIMNTLGDEIGAFLANEKTLDQATAAADDTIGSMLKAAGYNVTK
jgi:multiple sugar transport system substrate-binding protein